MVTFLKSSYNFDDQLSKKVHSLCICWDKPSENTGLWQLPKVSSATTGRPTCWKQLAARSMLNNPKAVRPNTRGQYSSQHRWPTILFPDGYLRELCARLWEPEVSFCCHPLGFHGQVDKSTALKLWCFCSTERGFESLSWHFVSLSKALNYNCFSPPIPGVNG